MVDALRVQKECRRKLIETVNSTAKILARLGNQVIDEHRKVTPRLAILLGSVLKAQESGKAILHLSEVSAVDEMNVLLRTLVELVINACYFQFASDGELNRFLHHDAFEGKAAVEAFLEAVKGTQKFPNNLAARVKSYAKQAQKRSGPLKNKRQWSEDAPTLKQRTDIIREKAGMNQFAVLLASVYVTGSGYTHAGFKTLRKHARQLIEGELEHPVVTASGVNSGIQGIQFCFATFGEFIAHHFKFPAEDLQILSTEASRIAQISNENLRIHKKVAGVEANNRVGTV